MCNTAIPIRISLLCVCLISRTCKVQYLSSTWFIFIKRPWASVLLCLLLYVRCSTGTSDAYLSYAIGALVSSIVIVIYQKEGGWVVSIIYPPTKQPVGSELMERYPKSFPPPYVWYSTNKRRWVCLSYPPTKQPRPTSELIGEILQKFSTTICMVFTYLDSPYQNAGTNLMRG